MPRVRATPKPIAVDAFPLDSAADMAACGEALLEHGYTYCLGAARDAEGEIVRAIDITRDVTAQYSELSRCRAETGQVVLFDGSDVSVISVDDYEARYST